LAIEPQIYRITLVGGNGVGASNENNLKKQIVDISQRCGAQGWCPGTLGNISAFNSESGRVHIKRSGADLNRLELEDILTLDLDGKVLGGEGKPSIETNFHLGIYKTRKDARAVFHVHPPYATAYAVAGKKIPMVTEAAKIVLISVPLLQRALPGSIELANKVADGFRDSSVKAILLREHGTVAIGETLENAFHTTALLEDTAKIALLSSLVKAKFSS
jgi:L-fuculose-phosphate aldolase